MIGKLETRLTRTWHRLAFRFRRERLERELAEEIAFHREIRQADSQLGNITISREECRDMWSFVRLERFLQDIRYALRMFRRAPVFTAVAVLSLAVGIGGNAAMFSLVDRLLVRPLPYQNPARLVRITGIFPRAALPFFQPRSRTLEIAAAGTGEEYNLTGAGEPVRVFTSAVSANLFAVLGSSAARGRTFAPGEDAPGRDGFVILSHSLWKTRFGGDPTVIGRAVSINGAARVIAGVMPPGFSYPSARVQAWIPLRLDPSNFLEYWGNGWVPLVARLKPGARMPQATAETHDLVGQFRKLFPYPMARDWNRDSVVIPLQRDLVGDIRGRLLILLASVGLVLLIACANVASLLLSRATARRQEIALRFALGAGRARIVCQLLTESIVLALLGGGFGILLGMSALQVFKAVLPASTPGVAQAAIDAPVAAMVAVLALITGVAFGIAPALSASQTGLALSIRSGGQRAVGVVWARLGSGLIGTEVALTVVLLVSAGLLIRSLYTLSEAHPGFRPAGVLTVRISPNQSACVARADCVALYQRLLDGARGIPGVTDSAIADSVPLDGDLPSLAVDVEDHPKSADYPAPVLWAGAVSPGYVRMLHIPVLAGRNFTESDSAQSAAVILISAAAARHFWPYQNPIGKHIKSADEPAWRMVVGVVGDVRQYSLSKGLPDWIPGALYMPYAQSVRQDGGIPAAMTLLVSTRSATERVSGELRALAQEQNPGAPVGEVEPLDAVVAGSISDFRSTIRVFLSFAGAALLLAAIGIYGLISYWVTQRTYEIGLRVAIGATRPRIVSMILGQGMRIALYGIGAGLLAALAATRFLASLLYGVGSTDPLTFAAVGGLVLAVAAAATALPAWKASRIDPAHSLRA